MKKKLLILPLLLAFSQWLYSQENFVQPSELLATIPFRSLSGGVILLEGKFGNKEDTLQFILDTGSGGISLDSSTAANLGIETTPSDMTILGIGGIRKVSFAYAQKLTLKNLVTDSLNFHINDYSILSSVYGEQIDGIIGYSMLSRYIFNINYDSSYINVYSQGSLKYPRGGWLYEPILRTLPVQTARIRDDVTVNSRFLFDIGAGLCLMLSRDFIEDSSFLHRKRVLHPKVAEGVGGKVDMYMTVIKEVRMGPYKFRNVPTYIFDDTYNITSYPYLSGIIGNDLLRRFNVWLNYQKREFYFVPNKSYNDLFDYSYSGVELYLVDGQIILGDVSEGSPAALAGLREGDVVVAINKNFSQNLSAYKYALQNPGERIKMIITRDGHLMEIEFRIGSIF